MKQKQQCGFTLIEVLIVVGLVGVIAGFGILMSVSSIGRSSVGAERDLFVTLLLRGARAEALANADQTSHGIHIDNAAHQYVLFEGTSFVAGAATNRVVPFTDSGISITNTGGNDIVFEQLSGDVPTGAGTTTLSKVGVTDTITINAIGQIDW